MIQALSTTGIGSLPHRNAREACRLILDTFDIPFWPQLPRVSFKEFMVPQYSEGMPFFRMDTEKQTVWVERNGTDELERFYEAWTEESRIAISEDYAVGLHTFLEVIRNRRFRLLKGHVTGPLTFCLGLRDAAGKPVFYDEELREVSLMLLKAKVRWQIDLLKPHAEGIIIFIDEPILSALGTSSYLGVDSAEALRILQELTGCVREAGCISGIHCCGNADWSFVIRTGADVISFDAFDYVDTLALYPDAVTDFLDRGGRLAWGIVPTSDAIGGASSESLRARFDRGLARLSEQIPERVLRAGMLLTPSCGTGSRTLEETLKVFQLLIRLKESLA